MIAAVAASERLAKSVKVRERHAALEKSKNVLRLAQKAERAMREFLAAPEPKGFDGLAFDPIIPHWFPPKKGERAPSLVNISIGYRNDKTPDIEELRTIHNGTIRAQNAAETIVKHIRSNVQNFGHAERVAFAKTMLEAFIFTTGAMPGRSTTESKNPFMRLIAAAWSDAGRDDLDSFSSTQRQLISSHLWRAHSPDTDFYRQILAKGPIWFRLG
jgi:hypothetical protein